jgi:trehalose 6-phosphate synthase/phosphatase
MEWVSAYAPDFVLAIGDDWTDEDLFRALPPSAFTVRVGPASTAARFYLPNHSAVRRALRELREARRQTPAASAQTAPGRTPAQEPAPPGPS